MSLTIHIYYYSESSRLGVFDQEAEVIVKFLLPMQSFQLRLQTSSRLRSNAKCENDHASN